MIRAALYARVSSEQQADKDLSIPAQMKAMEDYASRQGWQVAGRFIDQAQSAQTADRPEFKRMISLAKSKSFEVILVWKFSRFARNREDSIVFKSMLRKKGVEVRSINEHIEDSPTGKLMEGIIEAMDEYYSLNLAQDTRRGMKETASRGFFYGGHVPLGYQILKFKEGEAERSKLEINPATAPLVRKIFNLFLQGLGGAEITKILNKQRLYGRSGKPWGNTSVYHVLHNSIYTGDTIYNRTSKDKALGPILNKGTHPALVSHEDFERIQILMGERRPEIYNPKSLASPYLLSGLVYCAACGAKMTANSAKSGAFHYYTCTTKLHKGGATCTAKPMPKDRFEAAIIECLKEDVLTEENLTELVKLVNMDGRKQLKNQEAEILGVTKNLEILNGRREKIYEALESGKVGIDDLAPRLTGVNDEIGALKAKLSALEGIEATPANYTAQEIRAQAKDMLKLLVEGSLASSKAFLRSFIQRVNVSHPNIEIEYTLPLGNKKTGPHDSETLLLLDAKGEVLPTSQFGSANWTTLELGASNPCLHPA